ncbi:MAG: autotransporter assembly complex protein TamA [Pseudomonadales bacterium]
MNALAIGAEPWSLTVAVEGAPERLDRALAENVRAFLSIQMLADESNGEGVEPLTQARIRRAHKQASEEIRQALMPFGYYNTVIESSLNRTERAYVARYLVEPGPPTTIQTVNVSVQGSAESEPLVQSTLAGISLKRGQRLRHDRYETSKQQLLEVVYGLGYLDARYTRAELRVQPSRQTADVQLQLTSGERYFFGDFELVQNILNPKFAARFVQIQPGEPFDARRLIDLQLKLGDTDYFSDVEVRTDKAEAVENRVPVTIETAPQKSQRYSVGAGFGTDTGARIKLGTEFRRLNRRGHQFSANIQASEIRNTVAAEYRIPIKDVTRDRYRVFARLDEAEVGDADTDQFSIGVRREEDWLGMRRQLYFKYDGENFSFGDEPTQQSRLLIVGASLGFQWADDTLFSRRGLSVTLDVHGGAESRASETTFVQSKAAARAVWPLGKRGRLLLRGEAGLTEADNFDSLPPGERFFTGGDRSVRGYAFESLSPENAAGDDIGGSHLTVVSAEVDYLVKGNFGLAAFFDYGGASDDFGKDLHSGVGIGLRYRSPVGMIRVDLAHPLDDETDVRLHLSLGPDL